MKKTMVIIAGLIAIGIVAVGLLAAGKPDEFMASHSIKIHAPAESIFPLINNLRNWHDWSPYESKDPHMKRTFSGPQEGKGAGYQWSGDDNVGAGSMEIIAVTEPSKVKLNLHFTRPFEGSNIVDFSLVPEGNDTRVTWAIHGPNSFISKVIQLFINVDEMMRQDFSNGLTKLKCRVEGLKWPQTGIEIDK